jgi:hypothetical protein
VTRDTDLAYHLFLAQEERLEGIERGRARGGKGGRK